jgi:hypothetical protein
MPSRMSLRTLITPQVRLTGCCFACVCVVQQSCLHADREKDTQANTCSTQQNALLYRWVPGHSRIKCKPGILPRGWRSVLPASKSPRQKPFIAHGKARPLPMLPISISNRKTSASREHLCFRGSHFHYGKEAMKKPQESEVPIPVDRYKQMRLAQFYPSVSFC